MVVEKRKAALEAERKRIEEEEARMAEEEAKRLREEEVLAASLASEEQAVEQQESEEEIEEEFPEETAQPEEENPVDEQDNVELEEENMEEEAQEPEDGAPEITQPEKALVEEEVSQPEQAVDEEEIPVHEPKNDDADDDEICEVTAEEVPASKRQSRGRTVPTIPSRTNPKRKAKETPTSIFTATAKASPKANRKVAFPQGEEEEPEIGQVEEVASPTSHTNQPAQATTELEEANESLEIKEGTESRVGSEEGPAVSEQPDVELVVEGPGAKARRVDEARAEAEHEMPGDGAADEVVDEEKAAKERDRKGKAKMLPKGKKKREVRVTR